MMKKSQTAEQGSLDRSEGERRTARQAADQPKTKGRQPGREASEARSVIPEED